MFDGFVLIFEIKRAALTLDYCFVFRLHDQIVTLHNPSFLSSQKYTNIQQRMTEQNQEGDSDAKVRVVKGILDLLDNFDRASGVIVAETEEDKVIQAEYKQAYQDILDQFEKLGVTEVETVGQEFDYELHQAVMQMPGTDYEEGFVCQELQKGFVMGEALIRPAMVAVAI